MTKVSEVLTKRAWKVRTSYQHFINNPFREETTHKLRVDCRKLRGVLNILKKAMYKEDYEKLNGQLRNIAMMLSDLREIDVLTALCAKTAEKHPDMSSHFQPLFFYLNEERLGKMKTALQEAEKKNTESKIDGIISKVETLDFKKEFMDETDLLAFINERLDKKYRKLTEKYNKVDIKAYEHVHEIRKDAKKMRFGARYLGKLTELDHKAISKAAKKIQDEFGEITDQHVNKALLEEYARDVEDENLEKLFLEIKDMEEKQ